ncbi:MAG TPA: ABC transporter ATP-binding protein [Acidimicrobiales bacterium]|jgi:iron(III) transport system ATP-binding protein
MRGGAAASVALRDVRKEFAGKVAIAGLTLDVAPGTFLVLLGPSGSGKTTLLRCVAGIERPTSGEIDIAGRTVVSVTTMVPPEQRNVAMVFQDYALWPHLSVRRNVGFSLARSGDTKEAQRRKVDDLLERVGIEALAERFPNELSGGEQQRVALARALAAEAGLILFDEPLSNLDADRREQLRVEIATLTRESGSTVIYITHDQSEAFALADRVGVLNRGELIQCATPEEIYRRPASPFVAKFTGVAGELAVQVRAEHEGVYEVVLAHGEARSFRAVAPQRGLRGAARVLVRAAGVRLVPVENEEGLAGVVVDVAFTGRGYEHVVKLGEDHMLRKVFASSRFDRDRAVRVVFEPATTLLFAEERGK